jgi:hypothetical protein
MLILIEYYNKFIKGNQNIPIPKEVSDFTDEYLNDNNLVKKFILDNYEITNNKDDKINVDVMYKKFRENHQKFDLKGFVYQMKLLNINKTDKIRHKGLRGTYFECLKLIDDRICELDEPE